MLFPRYFSRTSSIPTSRTAEGWLVVYPYGPFRSGYAADGPEREAALQQWLASAERAMARMSAAGWLPVTLILVAAFLHSYWWLLALAPLLVVTVLWWQRLVGPPRIAGLERVPPLMRFDRGRVAAAGLVILAAAGAAWWVIAHYHPGPPPFGTAFYDDIGLPVAGVALFGGLPFLLFLLRPAGSSWKPWRIALIAASGLAAIGIFLGTGRFLHPKPKIVIAEVALICDGRSVPWVDVADFRVHRTFRRTKGRQVIVELDLVPEPAFPQPGNARIFRCNVSDLNEAADTIATAIRGEWEASRTKHWVITPGPGKRALSHERP